MLSKTKKILSQSNTVYFYELNHILFRHNEIYYHVCTYRSGKLHGNHLSIDTQKDGYTHENKKQLWFHLNLTLYNSWVW